MRAPTDAPRGRDYLRLLARYWVVIVLATALSAGAGWVVWNHGRSFVASVKFLVVTPGGAQPFDAFYGNLTAMSRTLTFQDLAHNPQVILRTEDDLGLTLTQSQLVKNIIVIPTQSAVFDVLVTATEPDVARDTANALARNMVQVSNEVQKTDGTASGLVLVDAASGAGDARGKPYTPMLTGGLLGLLSSILLIFARALAMGSVIDRSQVARIVDGAGSEKGSR
jgi:capsular polysaccharide biosynthesis protein